MKPILIEATDLLFFRDAVPMSAGQGKGAGCRLPFPSTFHEAMRAGLLHAAGEVTNEKKVEGRPRNADRSGNWHAQGHDAVTYIATRSFRSLRTVGPLPWRRDLDLLLPVPWDATLTAEGGLARLQLWRREPPPSATEGPSKFEPPCLPMATTPPDKKGELKGWWTLAQMADYLQGRATRSNGNFKPIPTTDLWEVESRIGVEIDSASSAAAEGQLYAGSFMRPDKDTRFAAWAEIADPTKAHGAEAEARAREIQQLESLDWLLLGGEFRLARVWHKNDRQQPLSDFLGALRKPPEPPTGSGPCLLKWTLVTPAIFAHGSLPGWCADTKKDRPGGRLPVGRVCLDLPARAHLVSWCIGKPRAVSGFDVVEGRAKPTQLAVPEGGVYYFLCETLDAAAALAKKLHWIPRSDAYGEKGCGYGFVSFDAAMHPTSVDVPTLAKEVFNT